MGIAYRAGMRTQQRPVGLHLRDWRQRRRMTQLDLACNAEVSPRHLSFVETGRSAPSREMILKLSEQLRIPMREQNVLLVAAGYAPVFSERELSDPMLAPACEAIDLMLGGHKPYPAFAVDRHWNVVASNWAIPQMYEGVADTLMKPPINAMRISLHPQGLAPRIANLSEWRAHLLARLRKQIELSADTKLKSLLDELLSFPAPIDPPHGSIHPAVAVPLRIRIHSGTLSFISTTMVFGTPIDITLSELAVESFFPADAQTAALVARLAKG